MIRRLVLVLVVTGLIVGYPLGAAVFSETDPHTPKERFKPAIVVASFGTTEPSAVKSIINIYDQVKQAYPGIPVKITFTSNIIRSVWKKRQAEADKWIAQGIPPEILYVKNIISTLGELIEEGCTDVIVQPTHIYFMEQSHDLNQYVQGLASIRTIKAKWRPFHRLVMGRPALGMPGDRYHYHDDLRRALKTLAEDVALAQKNNARLIYMAHGNEHWSVGIYSEAQKLMRELFPQVDTYFGAVEGFPGIEDVLSQLPKAEKGHILLKPFMIVAGDHALNDMAGDESDSWKNILTRNGFEVTTAMTGLGINDAFAQIFVDHIADAARDAGMVLKQP